mmetsp:Transcript_60297/g.158582  ORF Transcript_60297/g.158582 Transcript_60297/m.158582 type:complete len:119 (+) Transcript_60297:69-425(+)
MSAAATVVEATAPVAAEGVTYVSAPAPVTYVTYAAPEGVQYAEGEMQATPMTYYQAPAVYNVSPETFAKLAAGGSMTQEEVDGLRGGSAPAEAPVTEATTSIKKKSMKVSKKKVKGCC